MSVCELSALSDYRPPEMHGRRNIKTTVGAPAVHIKLLRGHTASAECQSSGTKRGSLNLTVFNDLMSSQIIGKARAPKRRSDTVDLFLLNLTF